MIRVLYCWIKSVQKTLFKTECFLTIESESFILRNIFRVFERCRVVVVEWIQGNWDTAGFSRLAGVECFRLKFPFFIEGHRELMSEEESFPLRIPQDPSNRESTYDRGEDDVSRCRHLGD